MGGGATNVDGINYEADRFSSGGAARSVSDNIANGSELHKSERYGDYAYNIPVTNSTYQVQMHFAETYWDNAGSREFNVDVEGQRVASNVDLVALAGKLSAYAIEADDVQVNDNALTISLETLTDNASMAAIEVWSADGEFVEPTPGPTLPPTNEDTGADCQIGSPSGSNGGSSNKLPDPFTSWSGDQVNTMEDWRCRRRELRVEVEKRILGEKAAPPQSVSGSVSSSSYTVNVQNNGNSTSFSSSVSIPSTGSAPYPAIIYVGGFLSLDSGIISSEGVATMNFPAYEIASEDTGDYTTGKYYTVNPNHRGETGALTAWAWGVSRIIDMLEQNPGLIDPNRIAVTGCSRFGKAAFVAGAFDQRIVLGLPFEPGTGGSPPIRSLPVYGGESLGNITGGTSWFGPVANNYNASAAADMHDVVAMYAPRGLFIMDNPHIDHLAFKSALLGAAAGYEVFKAMGASDALWYHANTNDGSHCSFRSEHAAPLRAMIRKFLKGDTSVQTGGIVRRSNQNDVNVNDWISNWNIGTISQ